MFNDSYNYITRTSVLTSLINFAEFVPRLISGCVSTSGGVTIFFWGWSWPGPFVDAVVIKKNSHYTKRARWSSDHESHYEFLWVWGLPPTTTVLQSRIEIEKTKTAGIQNSSPPNWPVLLLCWFNDTQSLSILSPCGRNVIKRVHKTHTENLWPPETQTIRDDQNFGKFECLMIITII